MPHHCKDMRTAVRSAAARVPAPRTDTGTATPLAAGTRTGMRARIGGGGGVKRSRYDDAQRDDTLCLRRLPEWVGEDSLAGLVSNLPATSKGRGSLSQ